MKSLFVSIEKEIITRHKRVEEAPKPYVFTLKKAYMPPADHPGGPPEADKINPQFAHYEQKEQKLLLTET